MTTLFEDPTYLEAVYAALFAQLQTAKFPTGFQLTTSRRLIQVPDQISPADQPALVLIQAPLLAEQKEVLGPGKWTLGAVAAIYAQADTSPTPTVLPATLANYLIWGLVNSLAVTQPPYQKQTLGGVVYHCWVSGEVHMELTEQQLLIAIPIEILAGPMG